MAILRPWSHRPPTVMLMLALMLSRRTIPHPPRVSRSGPRTGWRSTIVPSGANCGECRAIASMCKRAGAKMYLKLGSAQFRCNCADVAADDDDADVVLRAGVGSSLLFRIPSPKCDYGSFSPLAITDRSIAHPSLLLRSGIALACAPPLAISDRPHHMISSFSAAHFHHQRVWGRLLIP